MGWRSVHPPAEPLVCSTVVLECSKRAKVDPCLVPTPSRTPLLVPVIRPAGMGCYLTSSPLCTKCVPLDFSSWHDTSHGAMMAFIVWLPGLGSRWAAAATRTTPMAHHLSHRTASYCQGSAKAFSKEVLGPAMNNGYPGQELPHVVSIRRDITGRSA